ncbi:MAG: AAA family ATPase [Cyanobacteriota bacterium]|nr:AAA family ATPase [Cyanobacteriota bacterium]
MSLKKIELKGLRGFATVQYLEFAIPNGDPGSGITTLVGPNNGGKSTVIEAIRALSLRDPPSFTVGKRNQKAGDRVKITVFNELAQTKELCTIDAGGSETHWVVNNDPLPPGSVFVLPSRRYFNPLFGKASSERQSYIISYGLPQTRGSVIDHFASRLFQVQKNRTAFDSVLGKVLSPVPNWTIDQSDGGQYFLKFDFGGFYHNSDGLGEGLVSLFFIIDALYDSKPNDIIVIDEPELSLHPSFQRKLASLLVDYASNRQIIIATHSPYFVDFHAITNGAKIARIYSDDFNSTIRMLSEDSVSRIKGFLNNSFNPHVLGLDAREVFFLEERIILVEGQEDVVFYKDISSQLDKQLNGNFFGWGVGGAHNMEIIAALLQDLGFKKVVGILDEDKKELIPELKGKFPDYNFFNIPAKDVRTKPAIAAKDSVIGLIDKSGVLKLEYKDEVNGLFDQINAKLA